MSYKLYTDRNESFECEVSVKNASLKNSMARLIVESSDGPSFVFNGKIENGKCIVPIHRLKGLLDENDRGDMHLEVIVEDTYFKPWASEFVVEEHTSVKVKVNESKQPSKPSVTVKVPQAQSKSRKGNLIGIMELKNLCNKFGFTKRTLPRHKEDFRQLVNEYFRANPEFVPHKKSILGMIRYLLK
jgi:hypothetical protein